MFDQQRFWSEVDYRRQTFGKDWKDVASETGLEVTRVCRLNKGKKMSADELLILADWGNFRISAFSKKRLT